MPLDRPIPAFYCCYLLRSTVRRANVYIGSTPNPVRRLGQHNGLAKGGAARTNRPALRPWEMACIVTGFPSHIAALQFEWAWQNPHVTQHISDESRIQHATQKKRSGQPKRPRHSVLSLLSNLHLLLRSPSFSRWPLEIRFFSEDVYKTWMKSSATADGSIRDSIPVIRDFPPASELGEDSGSPQMKRRKTSRGIAALDVDYANHKSHVEKAREVMQFEREGRCAVCRNELEHDAGIYTVCPNAGCESVSHLTCLSRHFLESDESASLIPIAGKCPGCHAELRWVDVVKELTLRMRGQKEVEKLLKGKRVRKANAESSSQAMLETSDSNEFSDDEIESDIMEELKMLQKFNPTGSKMDMGDSWHVIDASDDSDTQSIASIASRTKKDTSYKTNPGGLVTVVEDSDWDDAEILD